MITRAQKVRLGIFVFASLALFIVTLVSLTGMRLLDKKDTYTIRYHMSLSGLEPGAQVKYNGVRVGSVDSIKINRDDLTETIVTVQLDGGTPIKTDTKAVVNLTGITGLKFIELTGGTSATEFVKPGGEIAAGESIFDRLTGKAESIAEKIEIVVNQIGTYTTDERRDQFYDLLAHIDELVVSVRGVIEDNRENVLRITTTLGGSVERLDKTLAVVEEDTKRAVRAVREISEGVSKEVDPKQVRKIVANLERITGELKTATDKANIPEVAVQTKELVSSAKRVSDVLELTILRGREDVFASLAYLQETLENLTEFSRLIRENPSLLLGGSEEKERKK